MLTVRMAPVGVWAQAVVKGLEEWPFGTWGRLVTSGEVLQQTEQRWEGEEGHRTKGDFIGSETL